MSFVFLEDDEVPHKLDDVARLNFYNTYGYTEECFDDKDANIRGNAYEKLGYTEKAFNDKSDYIRRKAYESLGYTKKAFKDTNDGIRYQAYEKLGYTEEALNDKFHGIRERAKGVFAIKNIQNLKDDFDNHIVNNVVISAQEIEAMNDNEFAHCAEDELMYYIIENMQALSQYDMEIVQKIMKDVKDLPYLRWYA
jgi:ElaB/YqjD/DUF883 family membrane-anchored ribosome-binding protein